MLTEYLPFILFGLLALTVGIIALAFSSWMGPKKMESDNKFEPYECGMDQMDSPHKPFALKFYTFALLFILFDIETVFLIPWAFGYRNFLGTGTIVSMLVFMGVLGFGLFYIIKTRALEWE